jgi:hypothetical protein
MSALLTILLYICLCCRANWHPPPQGISHFWLRTKKMLDSQEDIEAASSMDLDSMLSDGSSNAAMPLTEADAKTMATHETERKKVVV